MAPGPSGRRRAVLVNPHVRRLVELSPLGTRIIATDPSQVLAKEMHEALMQFVRTCDPGWPRYDNDGTGQAGRPRTSGWPSCSPRAARAPC